MTTMQQGDTASGAADGGNPVKVGGVYRSTLPTLTDAQRCDLQVGTRGSLGVQIMLPDSTGNVGASSSFADAKANNINRLIVENYPFLFNGTLWDRASKAASTARLLTAAASVNATLVKNAAGNLFKITGYNAAAALRYLKLYNKASAPTVGTDTPVWTEVLPATSKFEINFGSMPLYFATGIGYGLTTAGADADTGALTANDITGLNIAYT